MASDNERILEVLRQIRYPGFSRDIVSFGLVHDLVARGGAVTFRLELVTDDRSVAETIAQEARASLLALDDVSSVDVDIRVRPPRPMRLPSAGPPQPASPLRGVGRLLAVASGKGGVGKSTVAVNLAVALARLGRRVGLLDADIYGPSIPLMFALQGARPAAESNRAVPLEKYGVRLISVGFFLDSDQSVIWRGPMVMKAVEQLLTDVAWGELDELIVDLPPGTGDAQLTLAQKSRPDGAIVVTTPNDLALLDVARSVDMFRKVEVPVLGIIENMSFFVCPHCAKTSHVFAEGGARRECDRLGLPFLGEIPLHPAIRAGGDEGRPVTVSQPDSETARAFIELAARLVDQPASDPPGGDRPGFFERFRR